MAGYDINVGRDLLPGLLSGQNGLAKRVETVLNQILEAQVAETLGADRHERSEERQGYRNGYRARTLYTRVGLDGDGRAGCFYPQGIRNHRGTMRREILQINGQRAVCRAGCARQGVQRTQSGRRISVRHGGRAVHQKPPG